MIPPDWKCPRRIGFLFPHACDRTTPIGCADCQNGQVNDPYRDRRDRGYYTDYDEYDSVLYAGSIIHYHHLNFTEADGENLGTSQERFEDDMTGS